ncbi:MAG TPA: hypothetical protein VFS77_23305 [Pyrinomonadaceae bacterium]|nr:hypothetical protein [Pyrinomonadaceae bacterium]
MDIRPAKTALGLSIVAVLIAICCASAYAQSGRRQSKPAPAAPVPTPTPEPTPTPAPTKKDDLTVFLVAAGDSTSAFSNFPLSFYEAPAVGCADRLAKRTSASVDVAQRMSRGEAITRAKADKFTYVILVTLVEDRTGAGSSGNAELEVEYVVFAPSTAKVLTSGRTYENSARKGPLSIPRSRGTTLPMYREELLRRAGEDAAERILKALNLDTVPPTR